ncbi:MAG: ATP-binding cassette domain-containing protein [Azospirillaceae bacterium]|nr:ATP-binding cassette domain-containing protein [Azospirillaceae bacterium]
MAEVIPALECRGLSSGYGEAVVIRHLDLVLRQGETLALLGKNGMGKSTLLKTVMGYLPALAGTVRLEGRTISGLPPQRIARQAVSYTPQDQALFPDLNVGDNLRLVVDDERALRTAVAHVGGYFPFIPDRLTQKAGTLSGGEQKMLLLARALISAPRVMLVDEITEGLQPSVVTRLVEVLRVEQRRLGFSLLIVEQNVRFALAVADRYAVLKQGEIADLGASADAGAETRIIDHLRL